MRYLRKFVNQDIEKKSGVIDQRDYDVVNKFFGLSLKPGEEIDLSFTNENDQSNFKIKIKRVNTKEKTEVRIYLKDILKKYSIKDGDICEFHKVSIGKYTFKIILNSDAEYQNYIGMMGGRNHLLQYENNTKFVNEANLNTIFYGPAGTGKTYTTIERAVEIIDGAIDGKERFKVTARFEELKNNHQISFVTFHQSFSYEEFIEGISVTTNHESKQTEYKIKDGVFKKIASIASLNPSKKFLLIIDEINRGNVSKIFGELITLLEPSKRIGNTEQLTVKLPYTQEDFGVPNNLYIIGTMNSSDRSLTALDVAMRRRFKFEELLPNPSLFKDIVIEGIAIQSLLEAINERIEHLIGRDYCIGHAYFTSILETTNQTLENLTDIFKNQVLPLLQEYFYSDWEKIDLVLGQNQFIQKKELQGKSLQLFQAKSITPEDLWSINSSALKDSQNYIAIYKDIGKDVDAKDSASV